MRLVRILALSVGYDGPLGWRDFRDLAVFMGLCVAICLAGLVR